MMKMRSSAAAAPFLLLCRKGSRSLSAMASPSLIRSGGVIGFHSAYRPSSSAMAGIPTMSMTMTMMMMSRRWFRREPISQAQVQAEMEEEARNVDLAPHKLLQKGDPGTVQAVIRDTLPVGYWVTMPSGKDAYLPAQDLGFTGGLAILERLFKVGQEITVRVASIGGGGREILSIKKPEFAPPERKFSVSASTANRSHGSRY